MKLIRIALAAGLMAPLLAWAGEYQCKVYCKGPDGQTFVTVKAGSSSDAAAIVDKQGHQICKAAGHNSASSSTMSSNQCSAK